MTRVFCHIKALAILLLASCTTFEDPTLVIDLRVIAMTSSPPEQVLDIDLENPPRITDLLDQLEPSIVCATVADPPRFTDLRWSMTACLPDNGRCDPTRPSLEIASGVATDPELSGAPICAVIEPSSSLLAILADAFEEDTFRGLAGLTYSIEFRVGEVDASPDDDQFAQKDLHVFARFPADRVANRNPSLDELQITVSGDPAMRVPPLGFCSGDRVPFTVSSRNELNILPVELGDTRELYPVLTVEGLFETFDETITYQFLATGGSVSDQFTGGPRDFVGNIPPLSTDWLAPEVTRSTDVQLWINQRDERGGAAVYPLCIRVMP